MVSARQRLSLSAILFVTVFSVVSASHRNRTLYDVMLDDNRFNKISTMINDSGLSLFFEQSHITAFIPTTEALLTFDDRKYGYDLTDRDVVRSLLLYHIVAGTYLDTDLPTAVEVKTLHPSGFKVHFNQFTHGNEKVFTVNGAVLITSNIVASNGILHIIDRVMAPVTSPKTLHDYILYPEMPNFSFSSINNASIVDIDLKMWTNDPKKKFTLFVPDDSHLITMPAYGQNRLFTDWYLLRKIYHAHTVRDTISFIPSKGDIPPLTSMQGEITFIRENNNVYVKNNRVKAMVTQANIPTINGIVHVIDNLLYYIYMNIVQTVQSLPNTQSFMSALNRQSDTKSYLEGVTVNKTVFVPTDTAFAKLPSSLQNQFNSDFLSELLNNHIISSVINDVDLVDGLTLTPLSGNTITVTRDRTGIYLDTDGMRITVEETDIGCTNGVVHLISNVIVKKDYTVWEAIIGNITQISKMRDILKQYNDLSTLLNNAAIYLTVFLPIDFFFDDIIGSVWYDLNSNPDVLYNTVGGHVIIGHKLVTFNMTNGAVYDTYGGHKLKTQVQDTAISVVGSYISANIMIRDIICSNGVIHIIDNLMHVPTRNVRAEMDRHSEISVISSFVGLYTMKKLQTLLSNKDKDITIFVPTNKAFYDIPKSRANTLLMDSLLLERILQAHVVTTGSNFVEQLYANQNLISLEDKIFIKRTNNTVGLVSNNVHSTITTSNIRATNGVIHMVDRVLYYPYFTVAETMSRDERLIPFFEMIYNNEDFQKISDDDDSGMTVFVPSPGSLHNITAHESVLTRLFLGHVLPGVTIDQKFLRTHDPEDLIIKSENNVTFSMRNQTVAFSIDVGYSNLRYYFNVITDGIACSNGIVYLIDGLLNYNEKSLLYEIYHDSQYMDAFRFMLTIWPEGSEEKLKVANNGTTLFLPDINIINSLSREARNFLGNLTHEEREKFYERHVLSEGILTKENIYTKRYLTNGVDAVLMDKEIFLEWNSTFARILHSNILASNGIIHIIDNLLINLPEVKPIQPPDGTTKKSSHVNTAVNLYILKPYLLLIFLFCVFILM